MRDEKTPTAGQSGPPVASRPAIRAGGTPVGKGKRELADGSKEIPGVNHRAAVTDAYGYPGLKRRPAPARK